MSITKDRKLDLTGDEETQRFKQLMESPQELADSGSNNNLFAALEPQSAKIEAFLNDIEDEITNGAIKDENFAKGYLAGLMDRHELPLDETEQSRWVGKLMDIKKRELVIVDYPSLLRPEQSDDNGLWPKVSDVILEGGFKRGEMVILKGGGSGERSHFTHIDPVPFIVPDNATHLIASEVSGVIGNSFNFRTFPNVGVLAGDYDGSVHNGHLIHPDLADNADFRAFDDTNLVRIRARQFQSPRAELTLTDKAKRKSKNKQASKARRKSRN